MLTDIDAKGGTRELLDIDYREQFDRNGMSSPNQKMAIDAEIARLLDALVNTPDQKWVSVTSPSIEGGRPNPSTNNPETGRVRLGSPSGIVTGRIIRRLRCSSARFGNSVSYSDPRTGSAFEAPKNAQRSRIEASICREKPTF